MSCRVCCIKAKPYWYDRVHSDMLFSLSLSNPTICTLTFYSLDVAAVRDEPQSYRTDRRTDRCWLQVSAKPYSTVYSNIVDAGRYFTYILSKVLLQQCLRLQMRVFLLSFGPCLLYIYTQRRTKLKVPSGTPPHLYGV